MVKRKAKPKVQRPKTNKRRPARRRNAVRTNAMRTIAPISEPVAFKARDTKTETTTGTDFLTTVQVPSSLAAGSVVLDVLITPEMTPRLRSTTARYQRIKWQRIAFNLMTGLPSTAAGQFAVAFIRDARDLPPQDPLDVVSWVMAQQQSIVATWNKSVTLTAGPSPDLLYTSIDGEDRLWSPGRFVVVCVGPPTQPGTLMVSVDWSVHLSYPSIENLRVKEPPKVVYTTLRDIMPTHYASNSTYVVMCHPSHTGWNPEEHDPIVPLLPDAYATFGFLGLTPGKYLFSKVPCIMNCQFTAGSGKVVTAIPVHYWECRTGIQYDSGSTDKGTCIVPIMRYWNEANGKYDITNDWGWVDSASASYWSDIYCNDCIIPAGTEFFELDDVTVDPEPELVTVVQDGRVTTKKTGRFKRVGLPINAATPVDYPIVRVVGAEGLTVDANMKFKLPDGTYTDVSAAAPMPNALALNALSAINPLPVINVNTGHKDSASTEANLATNAIAANPNASILAGGDYYQTGTFRACRTFETYAELVAKFGAIGLANKLVQLTTDQTDPDTGPVASEAAVVGSDIPLSAPDRASKPVHTDATLVTPPGTTVPVTVTNLPLNVTVEPGPNINVNLAGVSTSQPVHVLPDGSLPSTFDVNLKSVTPSVVVPTAITGQPIEVELSGATPGVIDVNLKSVDNTVVVKSDIQGQPISTIGTVTGTVDIGGFAPGTTLPVSGSVGVTGTVDANITNPYVLIGNTSARPLYTTYSAVNPEVPLRDNCVPVVIYGPSAVDGGDALVIPSSAIEIGTMPSSGTHYPVTTQNLGGASHTLETNVRTTFTEEVASSPDEDGFVKVPE